MKIFEPRLVCWVLVITIGMMMTDKLISQANYESFTTTDGLSQGMILDMIQDKEGFIWIATKDGLNRYDGYEFKVYSNDPYSSQSLSNNTVNSLFEDSQGRIWAGTENSGLNVFEKRSGLFYRIESNSTTSGSLSGNHIKSIVQMKSGKMLVATVGKGLNIIELSEEFFQHKMPPIITKIALPDNKDVYGMGKDVDQNVYIGCMDGSVYIFDDINVRFTEVSGVSLCNNGHLNEDGSIVINKNLYLVSGNNARPLFDPKTEKQGNIIFKPRSALWNFYHREQHFYDIGIWKSKTEITWNPPLLIHKETRLLYPFIIDKSDVLWCGMVGYGIRKYTTKKKYIKTVAKGKSIRLIKPLPDNSVYAIDFGYKWMKIDRDGIIHEPTFSRFPQISQIDNLIISQTNTYYFKSDNKGFFKYRPRTNSVESLAHINPNLVFGKKQPFLEDGHGWIWLPGLKGFISLIHDVSGKSQGFSINPNGSDILCTAMFEDEEDIFWVGTETGFAKVNIDRNNIKASKVDWYRNTPMDRNSLSYNHISCFLNDPVRPDLYLWIATKGGGLNRLNKKTGDFYHYTSRQGLPDNVVYGLLPDEAGNIWGSTNKGIFCMTIQDSTANAAVKFRLFSKIDGLQGDEFNTGSYAKLSNGDLAFGGVNGLNIFTPRLLLQSGYLSNVMITKILVGNTPIYPQDGSGVLSESIEFARTITLNHLQDILTLEFSSMDFTHPKLNKYRYQLVGIDEDWVQSGSRRTATYLHLPAGTYTFKLQGSNSQGVWTQNNTEVQIIVLPPWYATIWAYMVYLCLIGLAVRAYFKYRINQTKIASQLVFEQNEARRIKELDTVKTRLYTNITHEFRTPLTVILGMVQQIANDPKQNLHQGLDLIHRNCKNLLHLVNEMLDLSKLEAGKMELRFVKGDLIQFLRYIVESFHSMVESQGKQMHYLASLDCLYAEYDAEKIRQVISNLLSNAVKFTQEKDNIYISISTSHTENQDQVTWLTIKIKDTGSGISEEQQTYIFERFYQADTSHTRKTEGTGIGLALTKELVLLMNGSIKVSSPPIGSRKGTEFTLLLPIRMHQGIEESNHSYDSESKDFPMTPVNVSRQKSEVTVYHQQGKYIILIVEDNADVVAYIASCLTEYKLVVGKDGQEGFDIACESIPDLIITDVMMPYVDGFEMCKRLRNDERTSHIPIIMLTAKADIESKLEGFEHGIDAYLEKPFYTDELTLRIRKLLEQRALLQQVYLRAAGLQTIASENEVGNENNEMPLIEDRFVLKVRQEIENHLSDETYSVEQLAKNIFMSHSQVQRKLHALTGYSPNQYIRKFRVHNAKELLKNTDDTITQIATKCGFNDVSYFGKVFKQECGQTPLEFRATK